MTKKGEAEDKAEQQQQQQQQQESKSPTLPGAIVLEEA